MFEGYIEKPQPRKLGRFERAKLSDPEDVSKYNDEDLLARYGHIQEDAAKILKRSETSEWFKPDTSAGTKEFFRPATSKENLQATEKAQREAELMLAKLNAFGEEIEKRGLKALTLEEREEKGDFEDLK